MSWFNLGGSESSTENFTYDNDAGNGLQDVRDTVVTSLAGVDFVEGGVNISPTDLGAIDYGFNLAAGSVDANTDVALNVLDVTARELEADRDFTGQLINFIGTGVKKELDDQRLFTAETIQHVTEVVTNSADAALLFVDEQNEEFKEALIESTERALQTADASIASNERITDFAFQFAGQGVSKALDSISEFGSQVIRSINTQATNNLEAVTLASRSDAANSLDQVVKTAGYGIMALAIAAAVIGFRR